jgi:hypothetical protein
MDTTDIQIHVSNGWAEAAAPTHGGRCPDCPDQRTGPAWDWVEHGSIKGTYGDGQCGGCGQLGKGWVHTGARTLPDDPADHEDFVAALKAEAAALRDEAWAKARSEIRADLADRLATAIREQPDRLHYDNDDEFEAELDAWRRWHDVSADNSGGDGPIFEEDDGTLSAWAWDPDRESGDGITVTVDDLAEARP